MKKVAILMFGVLLWQSCSNEAGNGYVSPFIMHLANDFIEENSTYFHRASTCGYIKFTSDNYRYKIEISVIEDKKTANEILDGKPSAISVDNTFFIVFGDTISKLFKKTSIRKTQIRKIINSASKIDFETPIWEIWLYKDFTLDKMHSYKNNYVNDIESIIELMKYVEIDTSQKKMDSSMEDIYMLPEVPPKFECGLDSFRRIIYEIDFDCPHIRSEGERGIYKCIIDTLGIVQEVDIYQGIGDSCYDSAIVRRITGLSGFSIPMHRGQKVKAYYTFPVMVMEENP